MNSVLSAPKKSTYGYEVDAVLTPTGTLPTAAIDAKSLASPAVFIVEEGRIAYVGLGEGVPERFSALALESLPGTVIVPGFIDAHHHVIEPFAKALTCGEPAQMWKRIWMPLEAVATEQSCFDGAKWTFSEALRGGITTIVEHAVREMKFAEAVHAAAEETGIRLVSSVGGYDLKNFSGSGPTPAAHASIDETLRLAEQHIDNCRRYSRIYPSVACGTVQSNSPQMIGALARFSRERNILFQIHANEHTGEVQSCIEAYSKRPIEFLQSVDALGPTTLIAHATLVTPREIDMLVESRTAVSYNPVASIWKGNAVAPALTYAQRGVRLALGTDATRNDGFRLLDAAETCQRLAYGIPSDDFSCGAGWTWVHAATFGGAEAIGLGAITGSLEPGKAADFLILSRSHPEVLPTWDLTWELTRFYDRADILATFVDGQAKVLQGRLTGYILDDFIREALPRGIADIERARITRLHGTSDLYRSLHNA